MAIGTGEKKSYLQTVLVVLLVLSCLGALAFFAVQSGFFKKVTEQNGAVDLESPDTKVDMNFLRLGIIEKLEKFPELKSITEVYGTSTVGRPNPFEPYGTVGANENRGSEKTTTTVQEQK